MTAPFLAAAAAGFGLSAGLIIAIGAQNAFVLRQGLQRQHVFAVVAVCGLSDAALIAVGAGGFGNIVARTPALTIGAAIGGAAFLFAYGARAVRRAWRPTALHAAGEANAPALWPVLLTTLALTWLNPHVYLDTIVLLGSVAAQYPGKARLAFAVGATAASIVWFVGLGYGAARLAPLFSRPAAWRILDLAIGCIMWAIAASLIVPLVVRC